MTTGSTRERLLSAAVLLFSEKGYRDTTVADVCDRAGANIASVNYHFRSKENLLAEVIREAFQRANEVYPVDGGLPDDASAEDQLFAVMNASIRRSFDPGPAGCLHRIMAHEGTRDAPPEVIHEQMSRLQGDRVLRILSELMQTRSKELLQQARVNVVGLCVFPTMIPALRQQLFGGKLTSAKMDRFVEQQFSFALAGIASLNPVSVK